MKISTNPRWQALAAAGLLAVGGAAGAVAGHALQPPIEMAPVRPVAIRSLPSHSGIVTVRARVAETYGGKIVLDDGSARTLIDLGHAGDGQALVADGQTVTVQGRLDGRMLRVSFLIDAAGEVHAIGPVGPGRHGHDGPPPPHGPEGPPPPAGADAPPPPPRA